MKTLHTIALFVLILFSNFAVAADPDDATAAARDILTAVHGRNYEDLWTNKTSEWYRTQLTKESFLANLTLGRGPLGNVENPPMFIDMGYAKSDPATGIMGEIYAFNFLTTYKMGKFYERVVVIKETDGVFRLTGLFAAPAQ